MSNNNPIETTYSSGAILYAIVHHTDGRVWDNVAQGYEVFNDANWASYAVLMAEQGTSGYYRALFPAAAGGDFLTTEVVYQQASGAPSTIDAPATGIGQSQGVDVAAIAKSVVAASRLAISLGGMVTGSITSAVTATATAFPTTLDNTLTDAYQGRLVLFASGALKDQVGTISHYDVAVGLLTMTGPFTEAPGVADAFIIV